MLSQTSEYALRAIVSLADEPDIPKTTATLAEHTQVQSGYLSKVMQHLVRSGIVASQRGLHGGFILTRTPEDITMLDVIRSVEPLPRINSCPLLIGEHGTDLCPLHRTLDNLVGYVEKQLGAMTIAKLMKQKGENKPLCEHQQQKNK